MSMICLYFVVMRPGAEVIGGLRKGSLGVGGGFLCVHDVSRVASLDQFYMCLFIVYFFFGL